MKTFAALLISLVIADSWSAENIAIVKSVSGEVKVKENSTYRVLEKGTFLRAGDILQTGENGRVGLSFNDGTVIALGPKSVFVVNRYAFKPAAKEYAFDATFVKGSGAVETGKMGKMAPKNISFKVPEGSVGVRGTKFVVDIEE